MTASAATSGHRFRPDIEGLRAIAVIAVVFYHAGVGWLRGGFVGVDVFYVISGYLITGLLWRELSGSGRLSFVGFYARRARRLLPVAMLALGTTMVVSLLVLPPLAVRSVWKDGLASALYVGNYRFAATQTNYLASGSPSPFQHFWSLGVEEQFYLLCPLLLVVASLVWWRKRRPSLPLVAAVLAGVVGGSLYLSVWLTGVNQPLAFFYLPTRAWELGIGGLVALGAPRLRRLPPNAAGALGWAGTACICCACVVYGSKTSYPGDAALLPVLGAAAVIAAGPVPRWGPAAMLELRPVRFVGRISYSWYLWHYPVLILAPYVTGHPLSEWQAVGFAGASGLLAAASHRFVEVPGRRWAPRHAKRGDALALAGGGALTAAGMTICLVAAMLMPSAHGKGTAPVAVITRPSGRGQARSASPKSPIDVDTAAFDSADAQVTKAVSASARVERVPKNLRPGLPSAGNNEPQSTQDGCLLDYPVVAQPTCEFGDKSASRTIVLFGDSHADMWSPAVDAYAKEHHYRLFVLAKATCPPVDLTLHSPTLGRTYTECDQWRANAMAEIANLRPSLVVLSMAHNYDPSFQVDQDGPAWLAGFHKTVSTLKGDGATVLDLGPVPTPAGSVPTCASAHLTHLPSCNIPRAHKPTASGPSEGVDEPALHREQETATAAGAVFLDTTPWFCTATICPAVVDNLLVYRDNSHITADAATYLAPLVGDEMSKVLCSSAPDPS